MKDRSTKIINARCAICGREIKHNEHFFIAMGDRTLCREDGLKIQARRVEVRGDDISTKDISSSDSSLFSVEC